MARALVTGASGYIGQHLCFNLLKAGWLVRGFSRSPRPPHLEGAEWMVGDILDAQTVSDAVKGVDVIVHLACLSLEQCSQTPLLAMRVNTEGTVRLLESSCQSGVSKFIFTSTSQVYGGGSRLPNKESDLPRPGSPYAVSKLASELWCAIYAQLHHLPVQTLRLFNVYGLAADGSARNTVETLFLKKIQQGHPFPFNGNPKSGRDFIHIHDVIKAILLAIMKPAWQGPINIGTGRFTSLEELAKLASKIRGKPATPATVANDSKPLRLQANTAIARRALNFRPEITLKKGLVELAAHL